MNDTEKVAVEKIDKINYVDTAEKVILSLNRKDAISTNQIRNILSLFAELFDMVRINTDELLSKEVISRIQYVKMRIVYAVGKDIDDPKNKWYKGNRNTQGIKPPVKDFVDKSGLLNHLKDIGSSRDNLLLVCRYMEALVAYHKFYGLGSDK